MALEAVGERPAATMERTSHGLRIKWAIRFSWTREYVKHSTIDAVDARLIMLIGKSGIAGESQHALSFAIH